MKNCFRFFALALAAMPLLASCTEEARNEEPLVDPWTRERTPVNVRLESQIGAATISDDWREPEVGTVNVALITGALDLAKVKVVAVDFKYPDSEFCPTCSIKPGDTVDLTSGKTQFVVTAYNGETRTYTLTYEVFSDPLVGTYTHKLVAGLLDPTNAPASSMVVAGGWTDAYVVSSVMDKYWQWDADPIPPKREYDNTVSIMLTDADAETGLTRGTIVNAPGEDGQYADFKFKGVDDVSKFYRIFPEGSSRWAKDAAGNIMIYAKEDADYTTPLYTVNLLAAGDCTPFTGAKSFSIPELFFARHHALAKEDEVVDGNWPDTRWMRDNIRFTGWHMVKSSDQALADHASLF